MIYYTIFYLLQQYTIVLKVKFLINHKINEFTCIDYGGGAGKLRYKTFSVKTAMEIV